MKRYHIAMLLMLSACSGNQISVTDEPVTDDADDDGGITVVDGTVTVTFSESGATVSGWSGEYGTSSVDGNDVTLINTSEQCLTYELSGTASDGFFKLYSDTKQEIHLNGVNLTNPCGAAINNQSHKYTSVVISGDNSLADGSVNSSGSYTDETDEEDMKAAFFSEGQLIFSGDGSLSVTATGKAGITSDDYVSVTGTPTITVSSKYGHGIRGKEKVQIEGGAVTVTVSGTGKKGITTDGNYWQSAGAVSITSSSAAGTVDGELTGASGIKADTAFAIEGGTIDISASGTGAKGINCDGDGYFNGGTVTVTVTGSNYGSSGGQGGWGGWGGSSQTSETKAAKGIKFDGSLTFAGAEVTAAASSHEAIEAKGTITISDGSISATSSDDAINSGSDMTISGGNVYAYSSGNDGLDANGNMYIKGGYIYAVGSGSPEVALDANTEGGYKLYLSGGSLVAFGGLESGSSISQPVITVSSWTANTAYTLCSGDTTLLSFTSPSNNRVGSMVLSHASLVNGSSYTLKYGSSSTSVTASTSSQGGGDNPGGGGNPGGNPGGRH